MARRGLNISKACEACRKSKYKCSGHEPCRRCVERNIVIQCTYRRRARDRGPSRRHENASHDDRPPATVAGSPDSLMGLATASASKVTSDDTAHRPVYSSVTAAHGLESDFLTNPHLFYGASSAFAFLQQLHYLLSEPTSNARQGHNDGPGPTQEGSIGLDLFKQRQFFFGTPSRIIIPLLEQFHDSADFSRTLPREQALVFLKYYKKTIHHLLPYFSDSELDDLVDSLYTASDEPIQSPSQVRALALAILANGALQTNATNLAEMLFSLAKQQANSFDDVVSLAMIQISLLLAQYQNHMGRPNAAFLNIGIACRKVHAMGLNVDKGETVVSESLRQRRVILWAVYYHETVQALVSGRDSSLKKANINVPFPEEKPFLIGLCKIAMLAEDSAIGIYSKQCTSLWGLYTFAEKMRRDLESLSEDFKLNSARVEDSQIVSNAFRLLYLRHTYYLTALLTFRPFLIAEYALSRGRNLEVSLETAMWLQQACRFALNSAQDAIVSTRTIFNQDKTCKNVRISTFFLESSSVVLLYDSLRHPFKFEYNKKYIEMALQCIREMIQDEPANHTKISVAEMLRIVEEVVARQPAHLSTTPKDISTSPTSHEREQESAIGQNESWCDVEEFDFNAWIPFEFRQPRSEKSQHNIQDIFSTFDSNVFTADLMNIFPIDTPLPPDEE